MAVAALLAGCGGSKQAATTATTTSGSATTTPLAPTSSAAPGACTSYGTSWLRKYNRTAVQQGSPIRMVSACCGPVTQAGRHHCFLKVTLVGTKTLGCETVDLGPDGTPATVGRHANCALHR